MPIASTTVLNQVDAMASTLGQAMQMARTRLASTASPILRLMIQRDHEVTESDLLRRELDIRHVRTQVRSPFLNGRMERFFKSFKQWQRLALLAMRTASIQRRLDNFADWYNIHRPHSALGIRTPEEAFTGKVLRATTEEFIPARRNARDGPNMGYTQKLWTA